MGAAMAVCVFIIKEIAHFQFAMEGTTE